MALGVGVVITIKGQQALASMRRLSKAFLTFSGNMARARRGVTMMQASISKLAIGGAGFTLVMGAGISIAADFESAMAGVAAVSDRTRADWDRIFPQMTSLAKELGATTAFTATQAAEGMELLTRAGFTAEESMAAIGPVLNTAAAEGIELSQAADVVAKSIKVMGLQAADAERVTDVLAKTSALANTDILKLGESFKLGGAAATDAGFTFEETAAIFGKLADSGLQATMGGTSLTAMLSKLTKPTAKAQKFMDDFKISLVDVAEDGTKTFKKMPDLVDEFSFALGKIEDPVERAALSTELFGLRGKKAFSALSKAGGDSLRKLTEELENAKGAASEMAKIRLDTFKGQLTILQSSIEGLAVNFFGGFLEPMKDGLSAAATAIGQVAFAIDFLGEGSATASDKSKKKFSELNGVILAVAGGFVDARESILDFGKSAVNTFSKVSKALEPVFGKGGLKTITKWAIIFSAIMAVATPVLLGMVLAFTLLSGVIGLVSGAVVFLSGAFLPFLVIGGLAIATFLAFRNEGEGVAETIRRFASVALAAWSSFKTGFMAAFGPAIEIMRSQLGPTIDNLKTIIATAFGTISGTLGDAGVNWQTFGSVVGSVLGAVVTTLTVVIGTISEMVLALAQAVEAMREFETVKRGLGESVKELGVGGSIVDFGRFLTGQKSALEKAGAQVPRGPTPVGPVVGPRAPVGGQQITVDVAPTPPATVKTTVPVNVTAISKIDSREVAREVKNLVKTDETRGAPTEP